jgi:hypothetical protein
MARQPLGGKPPHYRGFTITHIWHATVGRTPLDEGTARRRDLYLTTQNTHKRQTSMPPAEFEPMILVSERLQTHALDCTATGIGSLFIHNQILRNFVAFNESYEIEIFKVVNTKVAAFWDITSFSSAVYIVLEETLGRPGLHSLRVIFYVRALFC